MAPALLIALSGLIPGLLIAVALHVLHLLSHALGSALEPFDRPSLRVDRLTILALAQGFLGLPHGLLGVPEPLLALHAHAAHAPLQFLETLPQGLLAPSERILTPGCWPCWPSCPSWPSACS